MNKNLLIIIGLVAVALIGFNWLSSNQPITPGPVTTPPPTTSTEGGEPTVSINTYASATNSTVVLNGTVNPNGSNTRFWYEYGETTELGASSTIYTIGSGFEPIYASSYIGGLKGNTTYHYRLTAANDSGKTASEIYSFKTTSEAPLPPGSAPTAETGEASSIGRVEATLMGSVISSGWESTYWFEYGESQTLGLSTPSESAGSASASKAVSTKISGLKPLTTYYFRLNAQNQFGTVNGEIATFETKGPVTAEAPNVSARSAVEIKQTTATLRATVDPRGADTTYWFEFGLAASLSNTAAKTTQEKSISGNFGKSNAVSNISGLIPDTEYLFRVVAKNSIGIVYGDINYFRTDK